MYQYLSYDPVFLRILNAFKKSPDCIQLKKTISCTKILVTGSYSKYMQCLTFWFNCRVN